MLSTPVARAGRPRAATAVAGPRGAHDIRVTSAHASGVECAPMRCRDTLDAKR
jgi:hypothetical protein